MTSQDRKIESSIRSCHRCSAAIKWVGSDRGHKVPIEYSKEIEHDLFFDREKHTYHSCKKKDKT